MNILIVGPSWVGDMVMALFGAPVADPRHADHAVAAALDMVRELEDLNAKWKAEQEKAQVTPPSNRPSVVVLPFDNLSGEADQGYFADAVVEEITATLSRVKDFFVIARNSAFAYKGRSGVDVRQVVRVLAEHGSEVRFEPEQLRLATTGKNFRATIPVYFHVVTDGAIGAVTDAQIAAQIAVLEIQATVRRILRAPSRPGPAAPLGDAGSVPASRISDTLGQLAEYGCKVMLLVVDGRQEHSRGYTLLELAMSWLAARPVVSSVIAGATKPEQIEANLKTYQAQAGLILRQDRLEVHYDVARRTVRSSGLPRFMAGCLLAGYAWLVVAGAAFVAGVGVELFEVMWATTLHRRIPEHLLSRIAHKHASLGITPAQYDVVHDNLFWAIVDVLGEAVTPEVAAAWDEVGWKALGDPT